ncbi:hypothetical protein FOA43_004263 [Brettanomyces nanus]|uniref:HhH-GPD domain-containing protein n=1 Tax=Eeniella nana TaxID=13502 RepID=A0A875SBG0_EENNA|nr:uncharacterized protein FOA43_004263 [Brettanomyces nanus]QPG76869.1 hypothetical protein FOA43_004263 [Brettanomyces nanus]
MTKRKPDQTKSDVSVASDKKRIKIKQIESIIPDLKYYSRLSKSKVSIPSAFHKTHRPEFIKGLEFVLNKDPSLDAYIKQGPFDSGLKTATKVDEKDSEFYFEKLASGLISQQLSGKAASSIKQKLVENVSQDGKSFPLTSDFYSRKEEELRTYGLSMKKGEYIRRLSKAFMKDFDIDEIEEGVKFDKDYFSKIDDVNLRLDLEKFKGVGPWSSSMFAMFAMGRLDIFEASDLGIRRGFTVYLKNRPELQKEVEGLFSEGTVSRMKRKPSIGKQKYINDYELMNVVAHQFKPYRSVFMFVLWRMSDTIVEALT